MLSKAPPGLEIWSNSQAKSVQEDKTKTIPQPKHLQNPQPQQPAGPPPDHVQGEAELPDHNTALSQVKTEQDAASTEAPDSEASDEKDMVQNMVTIDLAQLTLNVVKGNNYRNAHHFKVLGNNALYNCTSRQLTIDVRQLRQE